jgi:hypothetical protein
MIVTDIVGNPGMETQWPTDALLLLASGGICWTEQQRARRPGGHRCRSCRRQLQTDPLLPSGSGVPPTIDDEGC